MAQGPEHAGRRKRLDPNAAARIKAEVRGEAVPETAKAPDPPPPAARFLPEALRPAPEPPQAKPAGAAVTKPAPAAKAAARATAPDSKPASKPEPKPARAAWQAPAPAATAPQAPLPQPAPRGALPPQVASVNAAADLARNWQALRAISPDPAVLERNLVIAAARQEPVHAAFDVLRTRVMQALAAKGWRRVAITSPTKGCGKSFTAVNLAVALSRYPEQRTVLLDMDLRQPALAKRLGVEDAGAIGDMLRGQVSPREHLLRFGPNGFNMGGNVAFGLNARVEAYPSELFLDSATDRAIARIEAEYAPDILLFDMPPALTFDDAIALRRHVDCVLMIVGAGVTTPASLRDAVRRMGEDKPILGMVLNKADQVDMTSYDY